MAASRDDWAENFDPPSVPPAYARAVVSAYRRGQLTAARTVELLHHSVGETDLPEPNAMSLDELRGEFETGPWLVSFSTPQHWAISLAPDAWRNCRQLSPATSLFSWRK
jgi:hypothetical protein